MTKVLLAVAVAALACLAGGMAPDLAEAQRGGPDEVLVVGTIGCSGNNCVDIWKVTCANGKTKALCADLCDTGGNDDTMVVLVAGATPAAVLGRGDISSALNCAPSACVTRPGAAGPITATVSFSVASDSGTGYDSSMRCVDKDGFSLPGPTTTLVTSQ